MCVSGYMPQEIRVGRETGNKGFFFWPYRLSNEGHGQDH